MNQAKSGGTVIEIEKEQAKSGSRMIETEMPPPKKELNWVLSLFPVVIAAYKSLSKQMGHMKTLRLLLRSVTWDMITSRPKWHPEYFKLNDDEDEALYRYLFRLMCTSMIIIYNNLKKQYGEYLADEITANMAVPALLAFWSHLEPPEDVQDIDQLMQFMSDNYGGRGWLSTHWVSEDKTEYKIRWTRCAVAEILRAYGMHSFAENQCHACHLYFDCVVPGMIFGRTHRIGAGDSYCNYLFRVPSGENDKKTEEDYVDCLKTEGGRERVRHWEEVYRQFGKFKF